MKNKTSILILTKLVFILFISCGLFACNNADACDENKCLASVKKVYGNSKIYKAPDSKYSFYVVDSTGMRMVTTLNNRNPDVDGITEFTPVN